MMTQPAARTPPDRRGRRVLDVERTHLNMMVYGEPGVGKTLFAATGPGPVLFLDVDDGLLTLRDLDPKVAEALGVDPTQWYFESIRSLADIREQIKRLATEFARDPNFFGTVVLDNLTELQRVLMSDLLGQSDPPRQVPEIRDWGIILSMMQGVVRNVKKLPCVTVFIAHETGAKENRFAPALAGRIQEELPGYVDIVARYVLIEKEVRNKENEIVKKVTRKLRMRPQVGTPSALAKCRSGSFGDWEDPHLGAMIAKIDNK